MKKKIIHLLQKTNLICVIKYILWIYDCILKMIIPKPKRNTSKKKVILICSFGVGDAILFLSTIDKYQRLFPKDKYEITILCSSSTRTLFEEETDFNIIEFDIDRVLLSLKGRYQLYSLINKEEYEYLIDVLGAHHYSMNVYTSHASFAKNKITIVNYENTTCSKSIIKKSYTNIYDVPDVHTIQLFNILIDNMLKEKNSIIFHKTKNFKLDFDLPKKYYIVFPSSRSKDRNWPLDRYAKIIDKVYEKTNLPVVLTGIEKDQATINKVISLLNEKTEYYKIKRLITVPELIQVIKNSTFVIANDSGPYHISVSENIPIAGIMGGYTYNRYACYNFKMPDKWKKPYLITKYNECFNCKKKCYRIKQKDVIWPCIDDITIEDAWIIIDKMIDEIAKNK